MRIKALPLYLRKQLEIPAGLDLEREVDRKLNSESHRETTEKINLMSDQEFFELLQKVIKKRKTVPKYDENQRHEVVYVG